MDFASGSTGILITTEECKISFYGLKERKLHVRISNQTKM